MSLRPLFETGQGGIQRAGDHIAFHFPHYSRGTPHSTITSGGYKLIKDYDADKLRLFHLDSDIGEKNDLSTKLPEKTADLDRRLMRYLTSIDAALPTPNTEYDATAIVQDRGGRRGPRGAQIEARQKEIAKLDAAIEGKDVELIGELIAQMKDAVGNRPARPRGSTQGSSGRTSLREERAKEIGRLDAASKDADFERLGELVVSIKQRLDESRGSLSQGAGQRGAGRGGATRDAGAPGSAAGSADGR